MAHYKYGFLAAEIGDDLQWRNRELLPIIYERQNNLCWISLCWRNPSSVHEGIVTRGDVQGNERKRRILIMAECNCIALCNHHHKYYPSRKEVLKWSIETYGTSVLDWLENLPLLYNPVQGLIEYFRKEYKNV